MWADNNTTTCFCRTWHIFLSWPFHICLNLGLHGLGSQWFSWLSVCIYQRDRGLLGSGAGRGGGHFDSLTGTFIRVCLLQSYPRCTTREMGSIGGFPQLLPENRTGSSLGFIPPCPITILLHTSLPNGKKKGDSISPITSYIPRNSYPRRHGNWLFLWLMYFSKSSLHL